MIQWVYYYVLETIVECSPAEVARCCLEGNSGCGLEGSLGAVQWEATDLEEISGCVLLVISQVKTILRDLR